MSILPTTRILLFIFLFALLSTTYNSFRNSGFQTFIVDKATVPISAVLIHWLSPSEQVSADGHSLVSPKVRLSVLNGCEGTEVMLMLIAALISIRMAWLRRLVGIFFGVVLVYLLNQLRIATLYYCLSTRPFLFDTLHGYVFPVLIIAVIALFIYWLQNERPAENF